LKFTCLILLLAGIASATADVIYLDNFEQFPKGIPLASTNYIPATGTEAMTGTNGAAGPITAAKIKKSIRALFKPGRVPYMANYQGIPISTDATNQVLNLSFLLNIDSLKKTDTYGGFIVSHLTTNKLSNPLIWFNDDGQIYCLTNSSPEPDTGLNVGTWSNYVGKIMTNLLVLNYPAGKFSYSINSRVLTNMPLPGIFTNLLDRIRFDIQESFTNAGVASLGNKFTLDDVQLTAAGTNKNIATYIAAARGVYFDQTNSFPSVISNGFVFISQVHASDSNSVSSVLDQTPAGKIVALKQSSGNVFQFEQAFTNNASRNLAYPDDLYTLTINTRDQGILTPGLHLPSTGSPNTPRITNFSDAQMINSTNDFTLTWDSLNFGNSNDLITVEITDNSGNPVFATPGFGETNNLDGKATSVVIPAGTFAPAEKYTGTVLFFRFTARDTNSVPDVTGVTGYFQSTQFPLATITTGLCNYAVSPASFAFGFDRTNGTIEVTSGYACFWQATNDSDFVTITKGSGTSTGSVTFTVAENTTAYDRVATMTIAGQTVTITQDNPGCRQTISPASADFGATGGSNTFTVTSNGTNCEWTVASNDGFITITSTNAGIGTADVTYSVESNATVYPRTGTISVGSNTFTVSQQPREAFADLSVTKTNTPSSLFMGSNITYTVTVSNLGPDDARQVVFTDTWPAGVKFISASTTQGIVYRAGTTNTTITAELGAIVAGSNAVVTVTATPTAPGELTNTVTVTSVATDSETNNNSATSIATAIVLPFADLSVSTAASPNPVFYGTNLTFTVTVANNGPTNATGIVLTNSLPAGVTNVVATTGQGTCTQMEGFVICALNDLPVGSNAVVNIKLQPVQQGSICSTSTVTGAVADFPLSNNTGSACASVVAHDMAIVSIKAPATVQLSANTTSVTKLVKVTIQNRSPVDEMITAATVSNLVTLLVTSSHTNSPCVAPVAVLHTGPPQKALPVTLKPKQKFTVVFDVTFNCATDPAKATAQEPLHYDFSYSATVNRAVLDNQPDADPYDDICPRERMPTPGNLDPFPDGKIRDLGCGGKYSNSSSSGGPVTTDVVDTRE
jgi:uncharacterized repeat protein (TIGR01451 family)